MESQWWFSFLAGLLTTLSPCVLPVLPFLIGSALRKNKLSPLFMTFGLGTSFVILGYALSRFGTILGFDSEQIRRGSALILILMSSFFISKKLQLIISEKLTVFASFGSTATNKWKLDETSNLDSVVIGILMGVIWSPCAGPTLGVAISLASQKWAAYDALKIMLIYSIGAVIPMLMISYGLRSFFVKYQAKVIKTVDSSKSIFGFILLIIGLFVFFGIDKSVEAFLLSNLPQSWLDLITKY